jgi:predicted nucleic-acid-binding protein
MRAVDTNVLVRLLVRDDRVQTAAAEDFVSGGAWVSHVVLVEAIWVLTSVYGAPRRRVATALEMLLDHRDLAIQDSDVVAAALEHYTKRATVGFSDCLVLEIARRAGYTPLGTFDRHLGKLPGAKRLTG